MGSTFLFLAIALGSMSTATAAPTTMAPKTTTATRSKRVTRGVAFSQTGATLTSSRAGFTAGALAGVKTTTTSTTPTTPPLPGWPHTIVSGTSVSCSRNPGPNEVIVARDPSFGGTCAVLTPGFYPQPANLVVGNDAISSIKVGSAVRARAFKNPVYGGAWTIYPPNTMAAGLGSFDNSISSFRIEPANRSETCEDLREGEIALYELEYLRGDCVVLPGDSSYANPDTMGIEGDSISSMWNNSARKLIAYWHSGFNQAGAEVKPHAKAEYLKHDGTFTDGIDNDILSVQMVRP
jgi:hypothetical protein